MKKQPHVPAVARIMVQATRSSDREALLPTMSGFKSPVARDCTTRAPWAGTVLTLLALQLGFGLWLMPAAFSRCAPRARRPPPESLAGGGGGRRRGAPARRAPGGGGGGGGGGGRLNPHRWAAVPALDGRLRGVGRAGAGWGGCPARRLS